MEFLFFIENILSKINPKYSNFSTNKTRVSLSEMFTVTDEAYALTIILNQATNWIKLSKPKKDRSVKLSKKIFTKPFSGHRNSWNMEGQLIFFKVTKEIKTLRDSPETGIDFEKNY